MTHFVEQSDGSEAERGIKKLDGLAAGNSRAFGGKRGRGLSLLLARGREYKGAAEMVNDWFSRVTEGGRRDEG